VAVALVMEMAAHQAQQEVMAVQVVVQDKIQAQVVLVSPDKALLVAQVQVGLAVLAVAVRVL
tara:strand:+ start:303 stop:488 length:186 start_codon:yes stop_codon:yes gene_type:complete